MTSLAADPTSHEATMNRSEADSSDLENNEEGNRAIPQEHIDDKIDDEDAATQAASEDLKHATISDTASVENMDTTTTVTETEPPAAGKSESQGVKAITPEPVELSDTRDAEMKEQVSSPKKKRGREQDDELRDIEDPADKDQDLTTVNGDADTGRPLRSAPQKKRHRDTSADPTGNSETIEIKDATESVSTDKPPIISKEVGVSKKSQDIAPNAASANKSQTSDSKFQGSGFAAAAASGSAFGSLAGKTQSVFGSGTTASVFGAPAIDKQATTDSSTTKSTFGSGVTSPLSFGSGFGSTSGFGSASGFGSISGGFGAPLAGGFGSVAPKLNSFANLSAKDSIIGTEKPPKAFGAPDSDAEEDSEDGDSNEGENSEDEEKAPPLDEKKKPRIGKVTVESGEEGEATLLQFRAKAFAMVNKTWKEKGSGITKLNVPKFSVDYDSKGEPILGSFDPSGTAEDTVEEDSRPIVVRLIMRQDNTHRVILNTPILKGLKFEERSNASNKLQILFTAFEDGKHIPILLSSAEASFKLLISEISSIQHEL